jgi:hypothetical protein
MLNANRRDEALSQQYKLKTRYFLADRLLSLFLVLKFRLEPVDENNVPFDFCRKWDIIDLEGSNAQELPEECHTYFSY